MAEAQWFDLGPIEALQQKPLQQLRPQGTPIALTYKDGAFSAVSGACNHVGGPLGEGRLDGDYIVCPWHNWKFHCRTGVGEPGYEADCVPAYDTKVENGHLFLNLKARTQRSKAKHDPHPLARHVQRAEGPVRVLGLSTTAMDAKNPRYSASDDLLETALAHANEKLSAQTQLIKLNELKFRHCEGYYSKSSSACTWPCSITQMDPKDQLDRVYEGLVHWADVVLLATPIRWGSASSLYYKMVERLNCVQNQITIRDNVLIRNKVAGFIIMGGQDNIQAVAGQLLGFFAEIGFTFPPFPYIAHSRGWEAEDMEQNVSFVRNSPELHDGARELVTRSVEMAHVMLEHEMLHGKLARGGRKAHAMENETEKSPA